MCQHCSDLTRMVIKVAIFVICREVEILWRHRKIVTFSLVLSVGFLWTKFSTNNLVCPPASKASRGVYWNQAQKFHPPLYWVPLGVCNSVTLWLCGQKRPLFSSLCLLYLWDSLVTLERAQVKSHRLDLRCSLR